MFKFSILVGLCNHYVSVKVNVVVYFLVMDAGKAIVQVRDYLYATSQLARKTLLDLFEPFLQKMKAKEQC